MASENRMTGDEAFRELETQLAALRTTAKALREKRPSWAENLLHPGRRAKEEAEFSANVVAALKQFGASIRNTLTEQDSTLAELARQISEVRNQQGEMARLRERQEQLEKLAREQAEAVVAGAAKSASELREQIKQMERSIQQIEQSIQRVEQSTQQLQQSIHQLEQSGRDHNARADQLAAGQKDLANEFRERIQHLLDEQRVAIRQLALKASEDAILSDRARRATELKLDELAKRVPPAPPA